MKILDKVISSTMAMIFIAGSAMPVSAYEQAKEEVIYVMADAQGDVDGVYAVNIWNGGNVTDYGNYSSVSILNTNDPIEVNGDKITFSSESDKVYCKGIMDNAEIPWDISIDYFLDGKEISAENLAGKSGHLDIKFRIGQNKNCNSSFYDNYALQANFTLDTKICKNITAENATTANVGSKKQLTYTIFAGKGIDTVISADVSDFEMDSIAINGIKLNMNIDIDTAEFTDKVAELTDGITKINDGATAVSDGTSELKSGSNQLKDGSSQLSSGAETLEKGLDDLSGGIRKVQDGLDALNSKSDELTGGSAQVKSALRQIQSALSSVNSDTAKVRQLVSASGEIKNAISGLRSGADSLYQSTGYEQYKKLMSANGLDMDYLKASNEQTITQLNAQIAQLSETLTKISGIPEMEEQAKQIQANIEQLSDIVRLLTANNGAISGTEQYLGGLSDAVKQLYGGISQLDEKYAEFDSAVCTLAGSLESIVVNVSSLSTAINTLSGEYDKLDSGVNAYTSAVSEICKGYTGIVDGVSRLADGSKELLNGADSLDSGISELCNGVVELCNGAGELSDGTGELRDRTSNIDTEIEDKIDSVIDSVKGKGSETVSFVSEKNENVKSVQFVIKTEAIEIPEVAIEETHEEEKQGFFTKLLSLFRL